MGQALQQLRVARTRPQADIAHRGLGVHPYRKGEGQPLPAPRFLLDVVPESFGLPDHNREPGQGTLGGAAAERAPFMGEWTGSSSELVCALVGIDAHDVGQHLEEEGRVEVGERLPVDEGSLVLEVDPVELVQE